MKKVFLIHGFEGTPNGGWRPWLMAELAKQDIYACALPMPAPEAPQCKDWVEEIRRAAQNPGDEIYLVGHSLGGPAILRYLKSTTPIAGAVLVSSPAKSVGNPKIDGFLAPFDLAALKGKAGAWAVIHGTDDPMVPTEHAEVLAAGLGVTVTWVEGGKHLNGSAGWLTLPPALDTLLGMMHISP